MSEYFFLDSADVQRGPISSEMLPRYGVTLQTYVWRRGMPDWCLAGDIPELRQILTGAPSSNGGAEPQGGSADAAQPSAQTTYAPQPQVTGAPQPNSAYAQPQQTRVKPDTHLLWAILFTICCNPIVGFFALYFAMQVNALYARGLFDAAEKASIRGAACLKAGLLLIVAFLVLMLIYYIIVFCILGVSTLVPYYLNM